MYSNIIGTQQILVTAGFLGLMILVLIILRKKSTVIRASMKAGKRVIVVEDTAVSPSERLRLITVDSKEFIMVSAKGHPPSLVSLAQVGSTNDTKISSFSDGVAHREQANIKVENVIQEHLATSSLEKNQNFLPASESAALSVDEQQQDFAENFKRWRRQNDAR